MRRAMFMAGLAALAAGAAWSENAGSLRIEHPWVRPVPAGAPTAAGYLTIRNEGSSPDRLVSVSTPAAAHVEMHESSMAGGIMRMRPLPQGVEIAPGGSVTFAPGGNHLMLIGPRRTLTPGTEVPATLTFARAGKVAVRFRVEDGPAAAPMAGMR